MNRNPLKSRLLVPAGAVATFIILFFTPASAQMASSGEIAHINGIDMHYRLRGSGPPLVLLHGFGGCGEDWEPFLTVFAMQYQVIVPDLRGHGGSTNPARTFTHRQSAADILALLDQLGVKRFKAMGISSGGMTLLHMATQQPERIEAMVLIGATPYFTDQARKVMGSFEKQLPAGVRARWAECATRGDEQLGELSREFAGFRNSYEDMNFTPPFLRTIKARTLIVQGDRDLFFPVDIPVEMYHAIPNSELWIVPRAGHVPIYGPAQQEFERIASEFLRGSQQPLTEKDGASTGHALPRREEQ